MLHAVTASPPLPPAVLDAASAPDPTDSRNFVSEEPDALRDDWEKLANNCVK